jgi:hypothetical protein
MVGFTVRARNTTTESVFVFESQIVDSIIRILFGRTWPCCFARQSQPWRSSCQSVYTTFKIAKEHIPRQNHMPTPNYPSPPLTSRSANNISRKLDLILVGPQRPSKDIIIQERVPIHAVPFGKLTDYTISRANRHNTNDINDRTSSSRWR